MCALVHTHLGSSCLHHSTHERSLDLERKTKHLKDQGERTLRNDHKSSTRRGAGRCYGVALRVKV